MMRQVILMLLGGLLLTQMSCQRETYQDVEAGTQTEAYLGEEFMLDIDAHFSEGALHVTETGLRSISIGHEEVTHKGNKVFKPTIRLVEDKEGKRSKMRIFLRKLGDRGSLTMMDIPTKIIYDSRTGEYHFELLQTTVRLKKALSKITEGEWYISGFYGGSDTPQASNQEKYAIRLTAAKSSEATRESVFDYNFPLAFGWTKLERAEQSAGKSYGIHHNLRLKPLGTLLGIELENELVEDVTLSSVKMSSADASFSGEFVPFDDGDDALKAGSVPTFKTTTTGRTTPSVVEKTINPKPITLAAARPYNGRLYVWFMPLRQKTESIRFTLEAAPRKSKSSTDVSDKDKFAIKGQEATFNDSFRYTASVAGGFKSGHVYIFPLKVVSDLMITEVYHKYENGLSYAAVELYNPNKTDIDLSRYALARVKNQFVDQGYCKVKSIGGSCPAGKVGIRQEHYTLYAPHLSKTSRSRRSETDALILPLSLSTTHEWIPYRLGVGRDNQTQGGSSDYTATNPIKLRFLTESGYGTLEGNSLPAGTKPVLHGGKTMIVLGDAYQDSGATLRTGGISAQLYEAYKKGYCQYIVALDNRSTSTLTREVIDNTSGGFSANQNSGVMNLRYEDGLLLVKRSLNNGVEQRRVIDTTTPNIYSGENSVTGNSKEYWENMMALKTGGKDTKSTAVYSSNYQTRTVIERLPSYGWSKYHWHVGRGSNALRSIVSLGSRKWLGDEQSASWASVPQHTIPQ